MKKILLFSMVLFAIISCKNDQSSSTIENEINVSSSTLTLSERNEKLIAATKSVEGTLNADVYKDILTVQFLSAEPEEAQKIAEGIFNEIKKHKENEHIKTVMVCDINYKLLGYAGAKK